MFNVGHISSQFFAKTLTFKSYFKISTFQPNFLCSSYFNFSFKITVDINASPYMLQMKNVHCCQRLFVNDIVLIR